MYAHEYICFFTKYEYFMYFLVSRFFTRFFAGSGPVSGPVHILGFIGSMTGPVPITLLSFSICEHLEDFELEDGTVAHAEDPILNNVDEFDD